MSFLKKRRKEQDKGVIYLGDTQVISEASLPPAQPIKTILPDSDTKSTRDFEPIKRAGIYKD